MPRDNTLKDMGFKCYAHYLRSELWSFIRDWVIEHKGPICVCCSKHFYAIHHTSYKRSVLEASDLFYMWRHLHPVCDPCHKRLHFKDGTFRDLRRANDSFKHFITKAQKKVDRKRKKLNLPTLVIETMPFGIHRGQRIDSLHNYHLLHLMQLDDCFNMPLIRAASEVFYARKRKAIAYLESKNDDLFRAVVHSYGPKSDDVPPPVAGKTRNRLFTLKPKQTSS